MWIALILSLEQANPLPPWLDKEWWLLKRSQLLSPGQQQHPGDGCRDSGVSLDLHTNFLQGPWCLAETYNTVPQTA